MIRFYIHPGSGRSLVSRNGEITTNNGYSTHLNVHESPDQKILLEFAGTSDERTYYRASMTVLPPLAGQLPHRVTEPPMVVPFHTAQYALPTAWDHSVERYIERMGRHHIYRDAGRSPTATTTHRTRRAELAECVRETLRALRAADDYREALDALAKKLNHARRHSTITLSTVGAICDATEAAHSDSSSCYDYLVVADCGHAERNDETNSLHNGNTYCSDCADNVVEVDGDMYNRSEVYYWDSDDEYHLEPEPQDDEDEDSGGGDISSWGRNSSNHVSHDQTMLDCLSTVSDFPLGIEIEVESKRGSRGDAAEDTLDQLNEDGGEKGDGSYIMLKEDGSLSDNGFEIVTGARSLKYHLKALKDWVPHSSLKAWDAGNCGTHVHIDSRVFTPMSLGKLLVFINSDANAGLIKRIAGRHPHSDSQAKSYCAALNQSEVVNPKAALKGGNASRYRMVNLCNLSDKEAMRLEVDNHDRDSKGTYTTVELRIFRASLKKERLLAQIEFAHACVGFVRVASMAALTEAGFRAWLAGCAGAYKNLARFLGINVPKTNKVSPAPVAVCNDETV